MTAAIDSVIPFFGAADPTAPVSSASGAGMSFADICTAHLSETDATHAASAPTVTSDPSTTGNTTAPANPAPTKSLAKNPPESNLGLAFLVAIPQIVPAIQLDPLANSPTQPVQSLTVGESENRLGSGSDGIIQATSLSLATGSATAPGVTAGGRNVLTTGARVPGFAPAADPSPQVLASPVPAQDLWPLSLPLEVTPASSNAFPSSPSSLASGVEVQRPAPGSIPNDAPDEPDPADNISAARGRFGGNTDISSQAPLTATVSKIPSVSLDVQSPLSPGNTVQASQHLVSGGQVSPVVVEMVSSPDVLAQNVIQLAAAQSSQPRKPSLRCRKRRNDRRRKSHQPVTKKGCAFHPPQQQRHRKQFLQIPQKRQPTSRFTARGRVRSPLLLPRQRRLRRWEFRIAPLRRRIRRT